MDPGALIDSKPQYRRITHTRRKQLLRAAQRPANAPPPPPGLNECCGSSCSPCVKTLWKEEWDLWRERWGEAAVLAASADERARPLAEEQTEHDATSAGAEESGRGIADIEVADQGRSASRAREAASLPAEDDLDPSDVAMPGAWRA